jgi:hypothetical protein
MKVSIVALLFCFLLLLASHAVQSKMQDVAKLPPDKTGKHVISPALANSTDRRD